MDIATMISWRWFGIVVIAWPDRALLSRSVGVYVERWVICPRQLEAGFHCWCLRDGFLQAHAERKASRPSQAWGPKDPTFSGGQRWLYSGGGCQMASYGINDYRYPPSVAQDNPVRWWQD